MTSGFQIGFTPLRFDLQSEIQVGAFSVKRRDGFSFQLKDAEGIEGEGQCFPLPGLHCETQSDCFDGFIRFSKRFPEGAIDLSSLQLDSPFLGLLSFLDEVDLPPSLEFAVEQALLNYSLKKNPKILKNFFKITGDRFYSELNALFIPNSNSLNEISESSAKIIRSGFRAVKIKIGRLDPSLEIEIIRKFFKETNGQCQIRLDGNCKFTSESLVKFLDALQGIPIEYIEEPLTLSMDSRAHYDASKVPIAIDESLSRYWAELQKGLPLPRGVSAIVVKPTTIGGLHKTVRIMNYCNDHQLKCTLSSAFDPGLSMMTFNLLSQLLKIPNAMGFDTYKYFKSEPYSEKLDFSKGRLTTSVRDII